jgi:hypothetical protein
LSTPSNALRREASLVEHASSSLDDLIRAMVEGMIEAHTKDPELYEFAVP